MQCKLCDAHSYFDVIYETSDIYLAFDNYGLHYGHLLLIPKKHILNFSYANRKTELLVSTIVDILKQYFKKNIIIYEHGNITENQTSNISIDHAHLHLLPLTNGINEIEKKMTLEVKVERTELQAFYSEIQTLPYHFLSLNCQHSLYTYDAWKSQAFRETYALSEKIAKWDWKKDGIEITTHNSAMSVQKQQLKRYLARRLDNAGIK